MTYSQQISKIVINFDLDPAQRNLDELMNIFGKDLDFYATDMKVTK